MDARHWTGSDDRELGPDPDAGACPDCGAAEDEPCELTCGCAHCRRKEWEALDEHERYMADIAKENR